MMLIQGDIKYGPKLPIGKNGAKVQTYLSSAIDDHSRRLLFSRFYDNQEEAIIEDTFHQAILRHGTFDACYFDNGSQYIAKQIRFSLAKLGIRVIHAKPRSGKSKGKIEKFHQVVDDFIRESKLKDIKSLDDLNRLWEIFADEYYHKKPHEGISEYYESLGAAVPKEGITPLQEWNRDSRPLTFLDVSVVAEAFLHHEERKGLLDQLGLESRFYRGDSKRQLQQEIEIIRGVQHKKVVCILDEAHLLEKETLEEFRFLLNYKFDSVSPMAVVLVGQTELLENKLKLQRYAAIRQRIDMYCTLPHLDRSETEQYIGSHMAYSGCPQEVFTEKAVDEIHKASAGIPRMINRICEKALMYAFQQQRRLVDDYMIKFVVEHEMLTIAVK